MFDLCRKQNKSDSLPGQTNQQGPGPGFEEPKEAHQSQGLHS